MSDKGMRSEEVMLPDKTRVFSYQKAREVFRTIDIRKITVSDAVLLLLFSQSDKPIHGRTSMMKQVFLFLHEILGRERVHDPKFVPGRFGMYSFYVTNTLSNLEFAGYIVRRGRRNTRVENFQISEKGKDYVSKLFDSLPGDLQKIAREKRRGWDQLGYDGILRYVYKKYPTYRDTSVLRDRYAAIVWGRGTG